MNKFEKAIGKTLVEYFDMMKKESNILLGFLGIAYAGCWIGSKL